MLTVTLVKKVDTVLHVVRNKKNSSRHVTGCLARHQTHKMVADHATLSCTSLSILAPSPVVALRDRNTGQVSRRLTEITYTIMACVMNNDCPILLRNVYLLLC